ncbi:hypothetical protein E2C01_025874 [Portunus trituberculatus]|uniref:Uncharacterized protein n=1 Tax=Portunus trituberculatus TaxID=210409 RepID=A0A5B7EED4_PORTR|nr:hypothetical protein [Portunus trituberculatus]
MVSYELHQVQRSDRLLRRNHTHCRFVGSALEAFCLMHQEGLGGLLSAHFQLEGIRSLSEHKPCLSWTAEEVQHLYILLVCVVAMTPIQGKLHTAGPCCHLSIGLEPDKATPMTLICCPPTIPSPSRKAEYTSKSEVTCTQSAGGEVVTGWVLYPHGIRGASPSAGGCPKVSRYSRV